MIKLSETKICPICGKEFNPKRAYQKYCGKRCAKIAGTRQIMKYYNKEKAKRPPKKCKFCGKEFIANHKSRLYCSDDCARRGKYTTITKWQLKKQMRETQKNYTDSLCWHCEKTCGGCSWSRKLIPVEGWEAKKVKLKIIFISINHNC